MAFAYPFIYRPWLRVPRNTRDWKAKKNIRLSVRLIADFCHFCTLDSRRLDTLCTRRRFRSSGPPT